MFNQIEKSFISDICFEFNYKRKAEFKEIVPTSHECRHEWPDVDQQLKDSIFKEWNIINGIYTYGVCLTWRDLNFHSFSLNFFIFVAMVRSLEARGQAVNRLESCNFYSLLLVQTLSLPKAAKVKFNSNSKFH